MPRPRSVYRGAECGHDHPKWAGRCEACGAGNTIAEEPITVRPDQGRAVGRRSARSAAAAIPKARAEVGESRVVRWTTGIPEFDFVMGGGIVPGSMALIGGEPGLRQTTPPPPTAAPLARA